eukprot:1613255-Rhodomonas_salina.3
MGSIKYFVRQRRAQQKQAAANKIKPNRVTSSAEEETSTTESGSAGGANGNGTGSDQASSDSGGIEGKVAISPAKNPAMKDLGPMPPMAVTLPGAGELQTPREGAELRSRQTTPSTSPQQGARAEPAGLVGAEDEDDGRPRPPPKIVQPPPASPPGQPPRLLNHYQERVLLRKRRRRELDNELPVTSNVRRLVFGLLVGQGGDDWSRGTRQKDQIFFPRQFRWLCYLICLLWCIVCMFLLFVYGAAFDLHIALAWLRLSAMSIAIELAISQTLLALCGSSSKSRAGASRALTCSHPWDSRFLEFRRCGWGEARYGFRRDDITSRVMIKVELLMFISFWLSNFGLGHIILEQRPPGQRNSKPVLVQSR